jgi:hypothetical protein
MEIERNLNSYAQMVRWFSPHLLVLAAYRDTVARIFGEFADQRGIQHVADPIPTDEELKKKFCNRYDSGEAGQHALLGRLCRRSGRRFLLGRFLLAPTSSIPSRPGPPAAFAASRAWQAASPSSTAASSSSAATGLSLAHARGLRAQDLQALRHGSVGPSSIRPGAFRLPGGMCSPSPAARLVRRPNA